MPDFNYRPAELKASVDDDKAHFVASDRAEIPDRMAPLYAARAQALNDILALVCDLGNDEKQRAIEDGFNALLDRWILRFSKVTEGMIAPSKDVDWWREREVAREMAFFQGLVNLEIGEARDKFVKLEAGLAKLIADLDKKWATMSDESRRLEEVEAQACAKMSQIVRDALSQGTDAWARWGYQLQRTLEVCMKVPDTVNDAVAYVLRESGFPEIVVQGVIKSSLCGKDYFQYGKDNGVPAAQLAAANWELCRDPGMAASESVQKLIGPEFEAFVTCVNNLYKYALPIAAGEYGAQVSALQRLLPNQGTILVSLSQTRRDVSEFLNNAGLDKARALFDEVDRALDRWADGQATPGLKTDARAFANAAREPFKVRYERLASAFGTFVQANQGRFIGNVNPATEKELIFTDVWADRSQALMDVGMDERLKEWLQGTTKVDNLFASAYSQVFGQLKLLPEDMQQKITYKLDQYWGQLLERLKKETTFAGTTLDDAARRISDDGIRRDLDRSQLKGMLNA
jgi:hypothetical protein